VLLPAPAAVYAWSGPPHCGCGAVSCVHLGRSALVLPLAWAVANGYWYAAQQAGVCRHSSCNAAGHGAAAGTGAGGALSSQPRRRLLLRQQASQVQQDFQVGKQHCSLVCALRSGGTTPSLFIVEGMVHLRSRAAAQ
jgi:hypothetical protein